jgi:hypothetical protein
MIALVVFLERHCAPLSRPACEEMLKGTVAGRYRASDLALQSRGAVNGPTIEGEESRLRVFFRASPTVISGQWPMVSRSRLLPRTHTNVLRRLPTRYPRTRKGRVEVGNVLFGPFESPNRKLSEVQNGHLSSSILARERVRRYGVRRRGRRKRQKSAVSEPL